MLVNNKLLIILGALISIFIAMFISLFISTIWSIIFWIWYLSKKNYKKEEETL